MAVGYRGGLITGKIGGDVGYMVKNAKGRTSQGWRAYQAHVSNPNNPAQRYNRVILSTMAKAYSVLRPICDHSFEGVAGASRNQKEFAKYNIRVLQDMAKSGNGNFNPRGVFNMLMNPYIVSKGSLPALYQDYNSGTEMLQCFFPANLNTQSPTYKDLFEAMGWSDGGQITLMICAGDPVDEIQYFKYVRFVFKLGEGLQHGTGTANLNTPLFYSGTGQESTTIYLNTTNSSEGTKDLAVSPIEESFGYTGFEISADGNIVQDWILSCFAFINSTLVGNTWKRSTQAMECVNDAGASQFSLSTAIASYESVQNSSQYLNNGSRIIQNG